MASGFSSEDNRQLEVGARIAVGRLLLATFVHRLLARVRLKVPDPQLPSHQHCHRPHRPRRPHRRPCSAAAAQTEVVPPPCRRGIRRVAVGARLARPYLGTITCYKSFRKKKEAPPFLPFCCLGEQATVVRVPLWCAMHVPSRSSSSSHALTLIPCAGGKREKKRYRESDTTEGRSRFCCCAC